MYVVDTNVLSASALTEPTRPTELIDWMDRQSDALYLSVVTVAEIQAGIDKLRRTRATRKAERLTAWWDSVLDLYAARIVPLDIAVAKMLGTLSDQALGRGSTPGWVDLAIAATAQCRGYTVLTRNLRHFEATGVPALNPFESLPAAAWSTAANQM